MPDENNVTWIPNQNYFPGRNGLTPRYVILHGTAGGTSAVATANYFASTQNTANRVSSHYVIGVDGEIVQCVAERDGAWGNGAYSAGHAAFWDTSVNPNNLTISIEHCKPSGDNSDLLTFKQQAASFKLINDICDRWNIPKHGADASGGITGHFSLDPVNRSNCPGPYNWNALWSYLKGSPTQPIQGGTDVPTIIELNTPGVSQFWAPEPNGAWRCIIPGHDHLMLGNIRSFYVRFGNNGLNGMTYLGLPLTDMFLVKTGVYAQLFEGGFVVDDSNRVVGRPIGLPSTEHCYIGHVDSGQGQTLIAQPLTTPLHNQIKSLDAQLADALKNGGDPAQIAALQATILSLQGDVAADKTKITQAITVLQK